MKLSDYWKGIIAGVGALVGVVVAATTDSEITTQEWGVIVTAILTFAAVVLGPRNTNTTP